ncbi:MAG: hemin uptake protein HemP [Rhizobiales bacterium]|nr:hemin uptake protein HemP [Hyphomicrobiales bacterium]
MTNTSKGEEKRDRLENSSRAMPPAERTIAVVGDRIDSRDLFVGAREIIIGHGSDMYRLRLTAQNKLILTK